MLKTFDIIKLHFKSPLHLSRGREDYDVTEKLLHADTLQSALFVTALQLYGQDIANLEFFKSFQVSSAFPFFKNTYFLPKPHADLDLFDSLNDEDRKKAKKVGYLTLDDFEKVIAGIKLKFNEKKVANGNVYYTEDAIEIQSEVYQHVMIPRLAETDATPFYMDRMYFGEGTGFYFILQMNDQAQKQKILAALEVLAENGLGTDRNVGNGNFEFEFLEKGFQCNIPDNANYQYNLALYCPKDKEELPDLNKSYYTLFKRGGWIASPEDESDASFRKKSIYMFGEGSVFPQTAKSLEGKIVELQPNAMQKHKIWRDGRAFFIPCCKID